MKNESLLETYMHFKGLILKFDHLMNILGPWIGYVGPSVGLNLLVIFLNFFKGVEINFLC